MTVPIHKLASDNVQDKPQLGQSLKYCEMIHGCVSVSVCVFVCHASIVYGKKVDKLIRLQRLKAC